MGIRSIVPFTPHGGGLVGSSLWENLWGFFLFMEIVANNLAILETACFPEDQDFCLNFDKLRHQTVCTQMRTALLQFLSNVELGVPPLTPPK